MALFKKKNQPEETKAAVEKEIDYKELVLAALDKKLEKGNLYDGCIIMPRGFTVDVRIGRVDEKEDVKLLQVVFVIGHDDFDEPIIDPVDAQGKSFEEAAKMAVEIFYGSLWHPMDQALSKKSPVHIPVTYLQQHYEFDMYAQSIVRIGAQEKGQPTMLVNFILNEMPKYLGSKKYYWLRIYLAKHKDRAIIEVRINGSVCVELSKFFADYVKAWDAENTFMCEKQCAVFVQREDDQCPFTKETVMKGAKYTLGKLVEVKNQEEYQVLCNELEEIVGDKDLAAEIRIFVPEVMAKLTLGYQEGDSLFLIEGDNKIEFKKTQLRSYFYIQQAAIEFLSQQPPQQVVQSIVAKSVAFRELKNIVQSANQKAIDEGKEANFTPQDMYVPGTAYKVGTEGYKAW
ncbi:MAG: hypothetical protein IKK66_09825 [Ruminococcus sp.]|nr:hypothetical protein [Ruminococcus sp.]